MRDDAWFRRQVGQHANAWADRPREFTRRTAASALWVLGALAVAALLLGASLLGCLLLAALGRTGTLWLVPAFVLALAGWPLARALRLRAAAPPGVPVGPRQAREVHALVEQARAALGARPVDELRLDTSLQVRLLPQPRLGLLGRSRQVLVIGLPLMMALPADALGALVLHALAPLRREAGGLMRWHDPAAWLERRRREWAALAAAWTPAHLLPAWQDAVLGLFMHRFWPAFEARASVIGREQAAIADRLALAEQGAPALATALLGPAVQQRYLDEVFWPQRWAATREAHLPHVLPLRELRPLIGASLRHPQARSWLHDALQSVPGRGDLRAPLRDRLALTGEAARLSKRASEGRSAADALLGRHLDGWIDLVDAHWQREAAPAWSALHRRHREQRRLLTELAEAHATRAVSLDDHLLWIRTAAEQQGPAAAVAVARDAIARHPGHPGVRLLLATALLDARGPLPSRHQLPDLPPDANEALELLRHVCDEAMGDGPATDPAWALPAARRLERALVQREGIEALRAVRLRILELERDDAQALTVLTDFSGPQALGPARLGGRALRPLLERLKHERAIGRAWLVAKTDTRARGRLLHLLVIERSTALDQPGPFHDWSELAALVPPPWPCRVVDLAHPEWRGPQRMDLVQRIRDTPGGRIHGGRGG